MSELGKELAALYHKYVLPEVKVVESTTSKWANALWGNLSPELIADGETVIEDAAAGYLTGGVAGVVAAAEPVLISKGITLEKDAVTTLSRLAVSSLQGTATVTIAAPVSANSAPTAASAA